MADQVVLVNGLPGSGKTTLAGQLVGALDGRLLSKDLIKEALAATLAGSLPPSLGAVTMDALWALARDLDGLVVADSFWFRPRDLEFARAGIARSGASSCAEVWCDVPPDVARTRYETRSRSAVHGDSIRLATDWADWADRATPLAISPVIKVDTTRPIAGDSVARLVRQRLDARA